MLGTVAEAGLAWLVLGPLGWRWLLALSSLPLFLLTLLFPLLPESPFFLASIGRTASAQQVLEQVARANSKPLPKVIPSTTMPPSCMLTLICTARGVSMSPSSCRSNEQTSVAQSSWKPSFHL